MPHTVVEVERDHLIGKVVYAFLIGVQLLLLCAECRTPLREPDALCPLRLRKQSLYIGERRLIARLLRVNVVRPHPCERVRRVTMQIDECLEPVFLTAVKQPVNRTFPIAAHMVGIEVPQEVTADHRARTALPAERIRDKAQILLKGLRPIHRLHEQNETRGNIVDEILVL